MRLTVPLASVILAASLCCSGAAWAVNTCKADTLSCPTTMPVGGYCECSAHGNTQSGTVIAKSSKTKTNATAGGCGDHPGAPGCH